MGKTTQKQRTLLCLKSLLAWITKVDDLSTVCEGHQGHVLPRQDKVFDDSQLSVNKCFL